MPAAYPIQIIHAYTHQHIRFGSGQMARSTGNRHMKMVHLWRLEMACFSARWTCFASPVVSGMLPGMVAIACLTPTVCMRRIVPATMLEALGWVVLGCWQTMALQMFEALTRCPLRQCAANANVQAIMQVHLSGGALHGSRCIMAVISQVQPNLLRTPILYFSCEFLGTQCVSEQELAKAWRAFSSSVAFRFQAFL